MPSFFYSLIQEMNLRNDLCPEGYNQEVSDAAKEPPEIRVKMTRHLSHVGFPRAPYWDRFYWMVIFQSFLVVVGGGEDLRPYWSDYLKRTHILVYVVDSSDRSRLPLAKAELHRLLRVEPQLPVVILGNKQVNSSPQVHY